MFLFKCFNPYVLADKLSKALFGFLDVYWGFLEVRLNSTLNKEEISNINNFMNSSNFGNIYIAIAKDTKKGYNKEKDKF